MLSREMVMRINQMIKKEKMLWYFIKLSQIIFKEMHEYQSGEFVCGCWGLKDLRFTNEQMDIEDKEKN